MKTVNKEFGNPNELNDPECFIQLFQERAIPDINTDPLLGTMTLTETKEERDSDRANSPFQMGTLTRTDSREESDSDQSNFNSYNTIPPYKWPLCGTQTETRTREESDQDKCSTGYGVIS